MSSVAVLVLVGYVCLFLAMCTEKLAKGALLAACSALTAAAYWTSTPEQWHSVGGYTVWVGVAMGVLALIGGAVEEAGG